MQGIRDKKKKNYVFQSLKMSFRRLLVLSNGVG